MSGATLEQFAKPELIDHIRNAKTDDLPLAVAAESARLGDRKTAAVDARRRHSRAWAGLCSSRRRWMCGSMRTRPIVMSYWRSCAQKDWRSRRRRIRRGASASRIIRRSTVIRCFVDGSLEVQDEGSQLLALLLGARRGEMVCDFCAGAGGKTLADRRDDGVERAPVCVRRGGKAARQDEAAAGALGTVQRHAAVACIRKRHAGEAAGGQARPRAGRCAVFGPGHAAPQSRPEIPSDARKRGAS